MNSIITQEAERVAFLKQEHRRVSRSNLVLALLAGVFFGGGWLVEAIVLLPLIQGGTLFVISAVLFYIKFSSILHVVASGDKKASIAWQNYIRAVDRHSRSYLQPGAY